MARQTERIPLLSPGPGVTQHLTLHRYGTRGARPKAYLQASLHADETPAMMAVHHLLHRLEEADRAGQIRGEILVVPYANPIGLSQWVNESQLGRYELRGGGNFNRNWPDLAPKVAERVQDKLGGDAERNVALVRETAMQVLAEIKPRKELDQLRVTIARLSLDADVVLDLHCDDESLMHVFLIPQHWPEGEPLARLVGARAVLLEEDSGGGSFDEFNSTLWTRLAKRFPDHPIPPVCFSGTVECRGGGDVSDEHGEQDGEALFRFLRRRGLISGEDGPLPDALCEATYLNATQTLRSPAFGIVAYKIQLGDRVTKGQVLAEIIDPGAPPGAARAVCKAETDGIVLSRRHHKFVSIGQSLCKIVGRETLPDRVGYLLED
jgi:predicted deacylase